MSGGHGTLGLRLRLAQLALAWERLWPALWPAVGVAGGFLALALFNLLPSLPGGLHLLILVGFAVAVPALLWRGLARVRLPADSEALRRLECDSGLVHRPLHAVRDVLPPETDDPLTLALWQRHQERMARSIQALRVHWPRPGLPARDPHAVRAMVGLLLFVAAAGSWGDWGPRLGAALQPRFAAAAGQVPAVLDVWLTPPAYTGQPPVFLKADPQAVATALMPPPLAAEPVTVPAGSTVLARVSGGGGMPVLTANGNRSDFAAVDANHYQISQVVTAGDRIAVDQGGRLLAQWPIAVRPDQPPTIAFAEPPAATERYAVKLDYTATDDFGVAKAVATIRRPPGEPAVAMAGGGAIELPLPVPNSRGQPVHGTSYHDLTAHPWAGLPVMVRLTATDGAGQTGQSEEIQTVLPERRFSHPVAQAIIAVRKQLSQTGDPGRADAARTLSELSRRPGDFRGDLTVFLALRVAAARLLLDHEPDAIASTQMLLWETALRVEEGQVPAAERELREAQRALAEALDRNASDAELRQLMDQLQAALDHYLDALEQQMQQQLAQGQPQSQMPPEMTQQLLDRSDLQAMIDQMRAMAETGARDGARQMLSQLQQMLENLRTGNPGGDGGQQAMQMMLELQQLTDAQRQLLDQTYQQSPAPGAESPFPGPSFSLPRNSRGQSRQGSRSGRPESSNSGQQQQSALRHQLGDLMRRLGEGTGEIPAGLGNAERAMRDAERALGAGQPESAVPAQSEAVDQLQQGMRSLAQQLAERMGGMAMGQGGGQQRGRSGRGRDPLGRSARNYGQIDNNDVRIPTESDLQRARQILDELRRRAGQFSRPRLELDYIDRLLRQF